MRVVGRVLGRDIRALVTVPAAWIVIVGLAIVPALYAWFNIVGFWDPYSNTSRIRVAVANEDEGATKDALGFVNVGSMLETQLRANDQLGWYFVSADQARADVANGDAYAAFVIPSSFSRDLTGIVDGTYIKPNLSYYVNEKNNAVAPKITDAGATTLDRQINSTFVSTVARTLAQRADQAGISLTDALTNSQSGASAAITQAADKFGEAEEAMSGMSERLTSAKDAISQARTSLNGVDSAIRDLGSALDQADSLVSSTRTSLASFSTSIGSSLDGLASNASSAAAAAANAGGTLDGGIQGTTGRIEGLLSEGTAINQSNAQLLADLQALGVGSNSAVTSLQTTNTNVGNLLGNLTTLNTDLSNTSTSIAQSLNSLNSAASAISSSVSQGREGVAAQLPAISSSVDQLAEASTTLRTSLSALNGQYTQINGLLDQLDTLLDGTSSLTSSSATNLGNIRSDLETVATDIRAISSSNGVGQLASSLEVDPTTIATFMASPTTVQTQTVYPVAAYGSAMAPLFTNLSLWIGAFALVIILKLEVSEKGVGPLSSSQKYVARWGLLACFGVLQALVVSIGDLVIGVQTVSRFAFIATTIAISLSFVSIIYMLATCFQHIGKGVCVIIMVLQIPGASGLYPIEMMPSFFRALHPFFPFTYGINAMRETVGGFYGFHYLENLMALALYVVSSFVIGLLLRPYLVNLNAMVTRDLSSSGLFVAEATRIPSKRYRLSQIVAALADHDEFSRDVRERAQRFERRYPRMQRIAVVVGIVIPVVLAVLSVTNVADVPIILGAWVAWLLVVIAYMIGVQYVREALVRQSSLGQMPERDLRELAARRLRGARARLVSASDTARTSLESLLPSVGSKNESDGKDTEKEGEAK